MKRRVFSASLLATGALALPQWAFAQRIPKEGTEYRTLRRPAVSEVPSGKIEVVEFFWYSCPHCNNFEPQLEAWAKAAPPDVVLRRIPVGFREDFLPQQRLFFALEGLGKVGELHAKVFHAIHAERQPVNREDGIVAWAQKQGIDKARFLEVYNSDFVTTKVKQALVLQEAYAVEGVPALGIAGRYYTDGGMAGTMARALQVADFLIAQVRR
ncbi:MAG: thiol:disulfide interchange protein DsbA/DsbL [Pseudomonadota bacterium]